MVECETEDLKVLSSILILDKRAFHHGLAQNIQPQHSSHDALDKYLTSVKVYL